MLHFYLFCSQAFQVYLLYCFIIFLSKVHFLKENYIYDWWTIYSHFVSLKKIRTSFLSVKVINLEKINRNSAGPPPPPPSLFFFKRPTPAPYLPHFKKGGGLSYCICNNYFASITETRKKLFT